MEAFADVTRQPHSFLHVDLRQCTDDSLRLLRNFCFGLGELMVAYVTRI